MENPPNSEVSIAQLEENVRAAQSAVKEAVRDYDEGKTTAVVVEDLRDRYLVLKQELEDRKPVG